ncbi:DUF2971 domain-containing protein [Yersinia ruckeri]|nr:DUF2971 domain-containing protein [Yersinia ruckeri]
MLKTVYHFTKIISAKKILTSKKLKISRYGELNDPFELLSGNIGNKEYRRNLKNLKNNGNNSYGIISFSKSWKSPVQWAHYADNHRGVCLAFDIEDSCLTDVTYHKKRLINDSNMDLKQGLAKKFDDWKYEKESRIIIDLNSKLVTKDGCGNYFVSFDEKLIIKKLMFGTNLTDDEIKEFYHQLKSDLDCIELKKVRPAFQTFSMVNKKDWNLNLILS